MPLKTSVQIQCRDLATVLDYYTKELGFRIDVIFPADAPRVVNLSGSGIDIRLEQDGGVVAGEWGTGRAGMEYRDLIPDRLGGQLIASHIRIQSGGPVPDYVHHHDVSFQMIYCYKGWVKVVYEDQGPPFVMRAGDCVLQPPHIRHRVLECSDNMEVIEVSSPAEHETFVDHDLSLPNENIDSTRDFGGQRFVFHESGKAAWEPGIDANSESRDTGIAMATNGRASVRVVRPVGPPRDIELVNEKGLLFIFVLAGSTRIQGHVDSKLVLAAGDSHVLPVNESAKAVDWTPDVELLLVVTTNPSMAI